MPMHRIQQPDNFQILQPISQLDTSAG